MHAEYFYLMLSFWKVPIISVRDYWNHYSFSSLPAWGYVFASVILQNLLCRFLILQDPNLNTAIDNRRVYNLVAYFFFFNVSYHGSLDKSTDYRMSLLESVRLFYELSMVLYSVCWTFSEWTFRPFLTSMKALTTAIRLTLASKWSEKHTRTLSPSVLFPYYLMQERKTYGKTLESQTSTFGLRYNKTPF